MKTIYRWHFSFSRWLTAASWATGCPMLSALLARTIMTWSGCRKTQFSFWIPLWWFGTSHPISPCLSFPTCEMGRACLLYKPLWQLQTGGTWWKWTGIVAVLAAVQAWDFLCAFAVWLLLGSCVVTGFRFHTLSPLSCALQPGKYCPSDSHTMGSLTHLRPNSSSFIFFFPTLSNLLLLLLYVIIHVLCEWLVFLFGTVLWLLWKALH